MSHIQPDSEQALENAMLDLLLPRLVSGEVDVENVEVRMSASRGE